MSYMVSLMRGPSHNSKLPFPMIYRGVEYPSFRQLISSLIPPTQVSNVTIAGRLHRVIKSGRVIDDSVLDEILRLDAAAYQLKYGRRVTWVETLEGRQSAEQLYEEYSEQPGLVPYDVFRTRLKSLEKRAIQISEAHLVRAALSSQSDWTTDHGGGRRRRFVYSGDLYPQHRGEYTAFTSFLKAIGRYDERDMMHARLKAKWAVEDILSEPSMADGAPGYIYRITDTVTGKAYIGLTVNNPQVRLGQHIMMAGRGGGSLLHQAMRIGKPSDFQLDILETVEGGEGKLAEREVEWVSLLNTLHPDGFNIRSGGQLGSYDGRPAEWDGRRFRSVASLRRVLSRETGLAEHVIESRFREGKPLPSKARKHSKHADAGSPLFRQHLGILKRARERGDEVDPAWLDYDRFKADVTSTTGEGRLTRIDEQKPWGPSNWTRMDRGAIVERSHGKAIQAFGKTWPSLEQALREYGIGGGTFQFRIKAGMSVEEALATPLGPTSRKVFTLDGESWPSRNRACVELAARHGITPDKVKDRLVRKIPISRWKEMDGRG
ncbi:GIY-YIG nuclease family protein [Pararhizobium arenae]|uniref:GIY-YIG nuclease family protein n=1 Tax=Pararhizobium arenae TaxID=1856850 RepID=UPI001300F09A|nr:GIY-YIG nuclease family protein [Pararhizobium arenae]